MAILKFIFYLEQTYFWRVVTWSVDIYASGWIIWAVVLVTKFWLIYFNLHLGMDQTVRTNQL
jgi:hypothetical protein